MLVLPGDVLGSGKAGVGAWSNGDNVVRASIAGLVKISSDGIFSVSTSSPSLLVSSAGGVPGVGARVLARVRRVTTSGAHVDIILSEGIQLTGQFTGLIAREHTRSGPAPTRADECFRPGDIVAAVVASAGDASTLFLSTAPLGCGVVSALSDTGVRMTPFSENEMMTSDGIIERRKVARIQ